MSSEARFPTGPNGDSLPTYYVNHVGFAVADDLAGVGAFKPVAQRYMAPAPGQVIEAWLAELDAITARRPDDEVTAAVRLRAYTNRLSEYPADIARHALLGRTWRFFPTWEELRAICEQEMAERRAMVAALDRPRLNSDSAAGKPQLTPEARERIAARHAAYIADHEAHKAAERKDEGWRPVGTPGQFQAKYGMTEETFSNLPDAKTDWRNA